jgi:hypothetical protein
MALTRFARGIVLAVLFCVLPGLTRAQAGMLEIRPAVPLVVQSGDSALAAFLLYNSGKARQTAAVTLTMPEGTVQPASFAADLGPGEWKIVSARVALAGSADGGTLLCRAGPAKAQVAVARGVDLTLLPWKQSFQPKGASPDPRRAAVDTDDSAWPELRIPALWNDLGFSWCRIHLTIPESWRGRRVRLLMGAVDDNDVTYLNGEQIGRTDGWDAPRDYTLPERLIRRGQDNVLTVMVQNVNAGGGLYKPPFMLVVGQAPTLVRPPAPDNGGTAPPRIGGRGAERRPPAGKIGPPLPLRPFHVENGVLRYPEGTEVALWGVNIYPQSWYQFDNMKKLGVDMKATVLRDLDHLQLMGVEAIRIHVFDREISDGQGNLRPNEHLDLLDFLVAECSRRGLYMYFTPIAWWSGPNERKGAFSGETSKPGMMFVPQARAAAANYLKQFLTRVNRYSGRAYKDEPCLCLLEVMNEPTYFLYGDLGGSAYAPQGERSEVLERDHRTFRAQWQEWLKTHGLDDSPVYFPLFRYELMRRYIKEMVGAIRSAGAKQPVAISFFGVNGDDILQAIADSECDAVTVSAYPGGWERVNDGINLLPQVPPLALDGRLAGKARLAYEFDTPATNVSGYLYPAIAASFRAGEAQVACQFQYDSVSTARWNTDWNAHWLNWLYTPSKAASYMAGGETFRRLPRGIRYPAPTTELRVGPAATSFPRNISLLVTPDLVIHSRAVGDWQPLPFPSAPRRIVGVGSSPYADYGGTGLYTLERRGRNTLRLRINPDARLVGNSLQGSFAAPVAELEEHPQWFRLKMKGWNGARCVRLENGRRFPVPAMEGGWLLRPGVYEIRSK